MTLAVAKKGFPLPKEQPRTAAGPGIVYEIQDALIDKLKVSIIQG